MATCEISRRVVIERGGVAILMSVDPVSLGVLRWISCLFVKFASQFHWFYCFSVRWPSNMDISPPEKFWWFISQSDSGAIVLAHESGLFFCAKVWSHQRKGFASQRHLKRSWKLIEKILVPTYLEDVLQGMLKYLGVDREDDSVLGRCVTRDAKVLGSW